MEPPTDISGAFENEVWVSDFSASTAKEFSSKLFAIAAKSTSMPIIVYINSSGGEVYNLNTMIAAIDSIPNQVITVAMGAAFSSAAVLLSHGDIRFVSKHGRVMVHEVQGGAIGHMEDIQSANDEMHEVNNHFLGLLAENCNIKGGAEAIKKKIKVGTGRELFLNAEQALKFGIADHIGVPRIEMSTDIRVVCNKAKVEKNVRQGNRK